ncbi:hypothetical protein [Mycobacteroides abscessus]|uniref:hypothetical protein n=1 Tax=Mycobacteroides abscessus TaxID=36809 RepID=UPI00092A197C|nr:hypothetical protein [Mycobacteroides abscessus]MBE5451285.1 hypothetical protein [Mycobacteroides abscessus]MDO3212593.1 hypothetical protein [Mycobacteroides abscessus subsp. abscessus]MDO3352062.1 hypothetical protein [Mycobacteroides abscessus subsp. abscessus]PVA12419.1 hypothetical protein DDJ61_22760 [Mycobacteroides abscessus]PVA74406.1 hypothetical protein DDJ76_22545 [Mycobacteroides abscessus]
MSAAPVPVGYLSRTAAAELLGWYPQRLTHAIKRGDIEAFELGGRVLLKETDIQSFAEKLAAGPTPLDPKELP